MTKQQFIKTFEKFNQNQIDTIEDLFILYFVDGWGAIDTLKIPKESGEDYKYYLSVPISYRLSVSNDKNIFTCSFFISTDLIDVEKFLSDVNKFIERVRNNLNLDTFSLRSAFQESSRYAAKKVYKIRIHV